MVKLTYEELANARDVLERAGFSHAWLILNDDDLEVIFMVPSEDLVTADARAIAIDIMECIPGKKVWIGRFDESAPHVRLY